MKLPSHLLLHFAHTLGFFALLLGLTTACVEHKKKRKATALPDVTPYFLHGDPKELIADTVPDRSGLDEPTNTELFNDYQLHAFVSFVNRTALSDVDAIVDQTSLEEANSTGEVDKPEFISNYSFSIEGDSYIYSDKRPEAKDWPKLIFLNKGGRLVLKSVDEDLVNPIHYSVKDGREAFSILVSISDPKAGLTYSAFTFVKNKGEAETKPERMIEGPHNYFLKGDGLAIAWERDIAISVCGRDSGLRLAEVQTAMANWSEMSGFSMGMIGPRSYTVKSLKDPKPFNDLNQNCVFFPKVYRFEDQENIGVNGITISIVDTSDQEILNSSIFIFLKANTLTGVSTIDVLRHELGHFLGLGHEFNTALKTAVRSVMGYSGVGFPTFDDGETLRNLYPMPTQAAVDVLPIP